MKRCKDCGFTADDTTARCVRCGAGAFAPESALVIDGRYAVEAELGRGAMGVVYRARDVGLGRAVALKLIAPEYASDPEAPERFRREAASLASIRSQHVVQIYAFGPHELTYFFAMEYVEGSAIDAIIDEHRSHGSLVPIHRSLVIVREIASGLADVHRAGLVHLDVKPSNIVIETDTGRPVLVDFGLARWTDTMRGPGLPSGGTPGYMAPEQADPAVVAAGGLGPRADIYALGCTAFILLTGRAAFDGDNAAAILWNQVQEATPRVSTVRPELVSFDPVIARAMARDPAERYPTCQAFAAALDKVGERWLGGDRTIVSSLAPASSVEAPGTVTILVVDDDDDFRRFAVRAAQLAFFRHPVNVLQASSGDAAVATAAKHPPNLVLLDYDMPGLDGVATLSRLRALPRGTESRVVSVSAKAGLVEKWRFSVLGVTDFLEKPVQLHVLVDTVLQIARRNGWIKEQASSDPTSAP